MDNLYLWLKAFHIIAFTAWMAGMFYLPRLYVYHTGVKKNSESDKTFQIMERRLLRYIMSPAMIVTFILGISLILNNPEIMKQGWLHLKIVLVVGMAGFHGYLGKIRRNFAEHHDIRSEKFYRRINEVPTILLIFIVILAVVKPF